jgi:hypothetical protein
MPARTRTGRTGIVIAAIFPARELLATPFWVADLNPQAATTKRL